jgi:hypothetical protein
MQTLELTAAWDLTSKDGNIAVLSDPDSQAQDAASQCMLYLGELWYDTSQGIPFFQQILGRFPSFTLLRAQYVSAALMVPGIDAAVCYFRSFVDRLLQGQVQITNDEGQVEAANFNVIPMPPPNTPSLDYSKSGNSQYLPGLI